MTKQFCENRVMTEYHTRQPYFMTDIDDSYPSCSQSAATSEEMWKKFELILTPPNSPQRSVDSGDDQAPQLVPVAPSETLANLSYLTNEDNEVVNRVQTEVHDYDKPNDIIYAELGMCPPHNLYDQTLISDCMWNGVGYKASAALRRAHKRTSSPQLLTPCHANGCVDPRNIFPYPVGPSPASVRQKTSNLHTTLPKRRTPVDGAETPSDSGTDIFSRLCSKVIDNFVLHLVEYCKRRSRLILFLTILLELIGKCTLLETNSLVSHIIFKFLSLGISGRYL